jgi:hypothetical protein
MERCRQISPASGTRPLLCFAILIGLAGCNDSTGVTPPEVSPQFDFHCTECDYLTPNQYSVMEEAIYNHLCQDLASRALAYLWTNQFSADRSGGWGRHYTSFDHRHPSSKHHFGFDPGHPGFTYGWTKTLARTIAHEIYHHDYPDEHDHDVIYDLADQCVPEVETCC